MKWTRPVILELSADSQRERTACGICTFGSSDADICSTGINAQNVCDSGAAALFLCISTGSAPA